MRSRQTDPDPATGHDLEALFAPESIAVVGASANKRSQGYEFVQGLVEFGFPGPIYPVNPKLDELLGLKAYPRLDAIPGSVDFVVSAVPASRWIRCSSACTASAPPGSASTLCHRCWMSPIFPGNAAV